MWVKSQDDEILVNLDRVAAIKHHKCIENLQDHGPLHAIVVYCSGSENHDFVLGRYFTSKRAEEVLEEIEEELEKDTCEIYYMPLE